MIPGQTKGTSVESIKTKQSTVIEGFYNNHQSKIGAEENARSTVNESLTANQKSTSFKQQLQNDLLNENLNYSIDQPLQQFGKKQNVTQSQSILKNSLQSSIRFEGPNHSLNNIPNSNLHDRHSTINVQNRSQSNVTYSKSQKDDNLYNANDNNIAHREINKQAFQDSNQYHITTRPESYKEEAATRDSIHQQNASFDEQNQSTSFLVPDKSSPRATVLEKNTPNQLVPNTFQGDERIMQEVESSYAHMNPPTLEEHNNHEDDQRGICSYG